MKLEDYRIIFATVGLIGILIFASPSLGFFLKLPQGEAFSGLYILGPDRMIDSIPFNIRANVNYLVYLGVDNQMGRSAYYTCYVKLRSDSEPLPNSTLGTPSPIPVLYEYKVFIQDGQMWEAPLAFKVSNVSFSNNQSRLHSITITDLEFAVDKTALWNTEGTGYYYNLLVELWIFSEAADAVQFHGRFVHFYLNMTETI